jgi:Protein of unknown function DUF262
MGDETVQPRMEGSARAESMSVDRLLQLAGEGRLRMPDFQRPFRWENSDRRDLLDSIYRGYPVGTLLLWKNPPNGPSAGRPLFPGAPTPAQGDTYLIVDGQQRITTLWDALGATPERGKSTLFFDMATDAFVIRQLSQADVEGEAPAATGDALPAAPLYLVRDAATLSEWVPQALPRETKRQYFELGKRLREYTVALYVVEQGDLDVLRRVFDRANTSGKPMQREEVFHALVGSRIAGAAGLELVNAELSDLGFGRLEPATVLKAYEAVEGTKIGRLDPRTLDVETAHATLRRTATAFRAAIEFLMTSAAVPHVEVCPYELPLVVLARFFACHPRPSERSRVLLRRWFWRGSLGQRLGGASGTMQQHVNDIVPSDESASVQALLERTGMPWQLPPSIDLAEGISVASASGRVALCTLLAHRPRHLVTGELLTSAELFREGKTNLMRPIAGRGSNTGLGGFANRLLHPPTRQRPVQLVLECSDEAALFSHGIDPEAVKWLRAGNVTEFLIGRSTVLHDWGGEFTSRQAEIERDDAPPLTALTRRSA